MSYVNQELEFLRYMKNNGVNSPLARGNYISWLRYVASNFSAVNSTSINQQKINEIFDWLTETTDSRDVYQGISAISNITSSLNKYLKFINYQERTPHVDVSDLLNLVKGVDSTSTIRNIETRLGQGEFRRQLITLWAKCSVTKYARIDLLIASHIKPWRDSSDIERIDKFNGLLLTPNLDKLFDSGFISFQDNGEIMISSALSNGELIDLNLGKVLGLTHTFPENKKYLEFHRNEIFRK